MCRPCRQRTLWHSYDHPDKQSSIRLVCSNHVTLFECWLIFFFFSLLYSSKLINIISMLHSLHLICWLLLLSVSRSLFKFSKKFYCGNDSSFQQQLSIPIIHYTCDANEYNELNTFYWRIACRVIIICAFSKLSHIIRV